MKATVTAKKKRAIDTGYFASLRRALDDVDRLGDFYAHGAVTTPLPRVDVEGVGTLAFPLQPFQAEQLITIAERAPYGRGADTIVDTDVRRSWQIGPDRIRVGGPAWEATLAGIVARVAEGLGCKAKVDAQFYKALLYDEGSFFLEHRDTEKADGMFATLVVVLPSMFRGGELVVRHAGRSVTLDLPGDDVSQIAFAGFYADCVHELRPIVSGHRLALVYNLVRIGVSERLSPPDSSLQIEAAARQLAEWSRALTSTATLGDAEGSAIPSKLIWVLEHHYTSAALSFAALKNGDAAVAAVLRAAAHKADCALHLAMVSIHESGAAEQTYQSRRRWDEDDDASNEDFEVSEVFERDQQVEGWIAAADVPVELGPLPFTANELSPRGALEDEEPDEKHFMEASGNEGASFERTYRRAALVVWSNARFLDLVAGAGISVALPYLRSLTARGSADIAPVAEVLHDARALARLLIDRWPAVPAGGLPWSGNDTQEAAMLRALVDLQDVGAVRRLLSQVICEGRYRGAANDAIRATRTLIGWGELAEHVVKLVRVTGATAAVGCIALLDLLTQDLAGETDPQVLPACSAIADAIVGALPTKHADGFPHVDAVAVATLLRALWRLGDEATPAAAIDHLVGHPSTYPIDAALLPATLALDARRGDGRRAGLDRLREHCLSHLRARTALPLDAPSDWAKSTTIGCKCQDCAAFQAFLREADARVWYFKAGEQRRRHVEQRSRADGCEVGFETKRGGSPLTLVCTKDHREYVRRCDQREKDCAAIVELDRAT